MTSENKQKKPSPAPDAHKPLVLDALGSLRDVLLVTVGAKPAWKCETGERTSEEADTDARIGETPVIFNSGYDWETEIGISEEDIKMLCAIPEGESSVKASCKIGKTNATIIVERLPIIDAKNSEGSIYSTMEARRIMLFHKENEEIGAKPFDVITLISEGKIGIDETVGMVLRSADDRYRIREAEEEAKANRPVYPPEYIPDIAGMPEEEYLDSIAPTTK